MLNARKLADSCAQLGRTDVVRRRDRSSCRHSYDAGHDAISALFCAIGAHDAG